MDFLYFILVVAGLVIIPLTIAYLINVYNFYRHGSIFFDNANYYMKYLINKDINSDDNSDSDANKKEN